MTNYLDSYKSIFLDINVEDFQTVKSFIGNEQHLPSYRNLTENLIHFWLEQCPYHYFIPLLCVRTGFDLFLRTKKFPAGSEIIMSAINIPSMITLVEYHQLIVVPCDIDRDTLAMNINDVKQLISSKTVAIVYAHIYGRCIDVTELVDLANEKQLYFIEDCAESFSGFPSYSSVDRQQSTITNEIDPHLCYLGHPRSHLVLYSFGVLKFCTALGGGLAKIADRYLFEQMHDIYERDSIQESTQYATNVNKYFYLYWLLNVPRMIKPLMYIIRLLDLNHMEYVVHRLRAFDKAPAREELFCSLRRRPCRALLAFLFHRFQHYNNQHMRTQRDKAMYVIDRLVQHSNIELLGMTTQVRNFWLFPILVSKPDLFVRLLSSCHIDAYRGTTQLNVITHMLINSDKNIYRCPNAEYLIEHVIYLPVHCHVPINVLDRLIIVVNRIATTIDNYALRSKL
jgi:perosamine synthetase